MKNRICMAVLLSTLAFNATAQTPNVPVEATDPGFVMLDILAYRPVGLVATIVGGAVFAGISPLTALASIPEPHDAFNKTFNILVAAPAGYTFVRPIGARRFPAVVPNTTKPTAPLGASRTVTPMNQPSKSPTAQAVHP